MWPQWKTVGTIGSICMLRVLSTIADFITLAHRFTELRIKVYRTAWVSAARTRLPTIDQSAHTYMLFSPRPDALSFHFLVDTVRAAPSLSHDTEILFSAICS